MSLEELLNSRCSVEATCKDPALLSHSPGHPLVLIQHFAIDLKLILSRDTPYVRLIRLGSRLNVVGIGLSL